MSLSKHICSQINFPVCKVLDVEPTIYDAFETSFFDFKVASPYAVVLLVLTIVCSMRMISQVESLFSSIGRSEMKSVFYLYSISNSLLILTLCFEKNFDASTLRFINTLQCAFQSTTFFGLCVSGFTIEKIYGIFGFKSSTFMQVLSLLYFCLITSFIHIFSSIANQELITILIGIEIVSLLFYITSQMSSLKRNKGEIWGYGVLGVILIFYLLSKIHTFALGDIVANLSERNIDNMFMNICYTFLVITMCHKFWLSTYDFELECLALYQ